MSLSETDATMLFSGQRERDAAVAEHSGVRAMPRALDAQPRPEPSLGPDARGTAAFDQALLAELDRALGPERLAELMELLRTELNSKPRLIREAVADRDLPRAAHEVHTLKGAAACLGAWQVASAAAELEGVIAAARGDRRQILAGALQRVDVAARAARSALAELPGATAG